MLSGGERKRVALATILAWDPKILVLDEPTIGQDFNQKEKLRQFIIQLNSQGRTVIMVTHDVEFVADCNPRVIVMSNSRIITDGSAREVLTNYDILTKASVIPPQITQIFTQLSDLNLPQNIIDLYEAKQLIIELTQERLDNEGF
jgi:energy-coupling factor transport system ATP-binding protein